MLIFFICPFYSLLRKNGGLRTERYKDGIKKILSIYMYYACILYSFSQRYSTRVDVPKSIKLILM